MASAVARIVVQATTEDKKAIADKARKLKLPVSELMRRGAFAYEPDEVSAELLTLADSARAAAERAGAAIDAAVAFVEASNRRIAAMEAKAARASSPKKR
jgi:thiamine biosynthesis lipoprotein ApbE